MSIQATDRLIGPARGDAETAIAYAERQRATERGDVVQYIEYVFAHAQEAGLDPAIVIAQSAHETAAWTSAWWTRWRNPAGLGITGDPAQEAASGMWASGEDAAKGHLAHLALYVGRAVPAWQPYDPRAQEAMDAGMFGVATTLADLTGRWAVDPAYAAKVAARGNAIFPGIPDQGGTVITVPTTHSVEQPPIYHLADDYTHFGLAKWQANEILGDCFWDRNGGEGRYFFYHIQDGYSPSSLDYWSGTRINASSTVMAQRDGSLLYVIPREHGPWTNGDVHNPTWHVSGVLAEGGNPNNWSLTCEAEGVGRVTELPPAQRDAIVWWTEDELMRNPAILDNEWCMFGHWMINSVSRGNCGRYYQQIVDAINAWLDGAVTLPPEPAAPPTPTRPYPRGMTPELARELYLAAGPVTVPWASQPFPFDLRRSECRWWLARGTALLPDPAGRYDQPGNSWPALIDVIRRGDGKTRTFVFNDGAVFEQVYKGI